MSNIVDVVRQNLLNINQLKNDSQSVDSRLKSLEEKVDSLAELLNSHLASHQAPVAEEPVAEEPVAEEPVAEEPVAEEPVAEEGNLNLQVE